MLCLLFDDCVVDLIRDVGGIGRQYMYDTHTYRSIYFISFFCSRCRCGGFVCADVVRFLCSTRAFVGETIPHSRRETFLASNPMRGPHRLPEVTQADERRTTKLRQNNQKTNTRVFNNTSQSVVNETNHMYNNTSQSTVNKTNHTHDERRC